MPKNKIESDVIEKLQNMNLQQLGEAVQTGQFTLKQMRNAYTQMRDIAQKRAKRLNTEKNINEFGKPNLYVENGEYFRKTKNLVGEAELLKELTEVSKFLKMKTSTIKGQKEAREIVLENMKKYGFEVKKEDYTKLRKFMKWFKQSEFAKKYDSTSPVVQEVFNSEQATPEDWKKAFEQYATYDQGTAPVRQY